MNALIIVRFLHNFGSIIWIGSLFFLSFIMIPSVKKKLETKSEVELMNRVFDNLSIFIIVTIVVIVISGLLERKLTLQMVSNKSNIPSIYFTIHKIKFILTGLMVVVALIRQTMRLKMKRRMKLMKSDGNITPGSMQVTGKKPYFLVYVNTAIGILVVFLSGFMAGIK